MTYGRDRVVIVNTYEHDTPDGKWLVGELKFGTYPSLSWMNNDPLLQGLISPGQQQRSSINDTRTPTHGLPKAKPSSNKESMLQIAESFLSGMKEITSKARDQTSKVGISGNSNRYNTNNNNQAGESTMVNDDRTCHCFQAIN